MQISIFAYKKYRSREMLKNSDNVNALVAL